MAMFQTLPPTFKAKQAMVMAFAGGVGMLAVVVSILLASGQLKPAAPDMANVLGLVLACMLPVSIGAAVLGPRFAVARARARWEARADDASGERAIFDAFVGVSIVQAALIEGWGILGGVTLLLTGQWWALAAPVLAVALILTRAVPTRDRLMEFAYNVTGTSRFE
jgi:hypothetical protein